MPGLPRGLAHSVRAALRPLLSHSYTRTETGIADSPDADDAWGNEVTVDGTPVSGLPCVYLSSRRMVVREEGTIVQDVPTLYVPNDDTLAVGWKVTNVIDQDGTVLVESAVVSSFDPAAESGASAFKVCILGSVQAVP